jgi:HlyD family secretion protein
MRRTRDRGCGDVEQPLTPQSESAQGSTFRQAALDRVNNPEQLDRLLTVTTPRSWIALAAVAALIAAALSWSLLGRISSYVEGRGVFIREGGNIASAAAAGSGTLDKLLVAKGDHVNAGQVVAQIVAPDVQQQVAGLRTLVTERTGELERQETLTGNEIKANRAALNRRETALAEVQATAQRRAEALQVKLKAQQQLYADKIVTHSAVLEVQAEVDRALQEVASTADQRAQLDIQFRDFVFQSEQRVKNAQFALADAGRQLSERAEVNRTGSEVHAPVTGTVNEIQLRPGSLVGRGQSVLTIETSGNGLGFMLFAPLRDGEKIQPGQAVKISPNWTVREEEGTMLGTVTELSKLPITPEGLRSLLSNEDLVRHFSDAGPVFIVRVSLKPDPKTRSGYAWTSSKGAEVPLESGSFGGGEVLVKSQRPISLAIPALRRWTGMGAPAVIDIQHRKIAR